MSELLSVVVMGVMAGCWLVLRTATRGMDQDHDAARAVTHE